MPCKVLSTHVHQKLTPICMLSRPFSKMYVLGPKFAWTEVEQRLASYHVISMVIEMSGLEALTFLKSSAT